MDDKPRKHGAISWSELITSDVEGAKAFYGQLLERRDGYGKNRL